MKIMEDRTERIAKKIISMAHFGTYGGFNFFIKSKDLYEAAHVHAKKGTKVVKFWLKPKVSLFRPKKTAIPFNASELGDCTKIVEEHREEFLKKFQDEQRKNGIAENQRNQQRRKKAFRIPSMIKKKTIETLPFLGDLLSAIERSLIEDIICDNDSCVISFIPNRHGVKAWLELCRFKGKQHIDFELIEACEGDRKFLDYEVFISDENKRPVQRKIVSELQKCYARKDRTERIAKKITELYDEPQGGNKIENLSEADSL